MERGAGLVERLLDIKMADFRVRIAHLASDKDGGAGRDEVERQIGLVPFGGGASAQFGQKVRGGELPHELGTAHLANGARFGGLARVAGGVNARRERKVIRGSDKAFRTKQASVRARAGGADDQVRVNHRPVRQRQGVFADVAHPAADVRLQFRQAAKRAEEWLLILSQYPAEHGTRWLNQAGSPRTQPRRRTASRLDAQHARPDNGDGTGCLETFADGKRVGHRPKRKCALPATREGWNERTGACGDDEAVVGATIDRSGGGVDVGGGLVAEVDTGLVVGLLGLDGDGVGVSLAEGDGDEARAEVGEARLVGEKRNLGAAFGKGKGGLDAGVPGADKRGGAGFRLSCAQCA